MISRQRNAALRARRSMRSEDREIASLRICEKLLRSHEFFAADSIACYLPMPDEVDPGAIIERAWRAKKRIFCPVMRKPGEMTFHRLDRDTTLERNGYGLWEPVDGEIISPRHLDLVVTPLVAFDANCNRIGMGGGYFDRCFRFLKSRRHWQRPKLVGVAFACQEVEKIEPNPWDIRLYSVLTDADRT